MRDVNYYRIRIRQAQRHQPKTERPLKWVLALILFVATLTVTFDDVGGPGLSESETFQQFDMGSTAATGVTGASGVSSSDN